MTLGMNIELVIYRTIFKPHMHTLTLTHTYPFIIIAEHIAVYCPNVIIECNVFIEIVDQNNINAKSTVYAFWFRLLVPLLYIVHYYRFQFWHAGLHMKLLCRSRNFQIVYLLDNVICYHSERVLLLWGCFQFQKQ